MFVLIDRLIHSVGYSIADEHVLRLVELRFSTRKKIIFLRFFFHSNFT